VGTYQNEAVIRRLLDAILLAQNDERAVRRLRFMTLETTIPWSDEAFASLPAVAI
jgi:hypothetical protein